MKEYIKNNNIENGDEILHEYQSAYEEYRNSQKQMENITGMMPSLRSHIEKAYIFRFCLIHDIKLSELRYFGRKEAENHMFQQLRDLVRNGNDHNLLIGEMGFYPCNGGPPRKEKYPSQYLFNEWHYCNTCVSESELIEDVKNKDWVHNIVIKYGYQWIPQLNLPTY